MTKLCRTCEKLTKTSAVSYGVKS